MPKNPFKKSLQEDIFKFRKTPSSHFRTPLKSISLSARRFIIRGCKHLKTQLFARKNTPKNESQETGRNDKAATLADVDRFLFENFKSLYINDTNDDEESKCKVPNEPPRFVNPPPNLCGSQRVFMTTGSSSSLMEDVRRVSSTSSDDVAPSSTTIRTCTTRSSRVAGTSTPRKDSKEVMGSEEFTALLTYSLSPYHDFKQSMQEMIDARLHHHGKVDWEFMEELLSRYMDLNDKKAYKYILSAFVDVALTLRETPARSR